MTRLAAALALAVVAGAPARVHGHQTDEYLQATRLSIARDRLVVNLTLTPGAAVAPRVFAAADRDRDAKISPLEVEAYARGVLRDLTLAVDGRTLPLTLVRAESASWEEMQEGDGAIRVAAVADIPPIGRGSHAITYVNAHDPANGIYLVNALVPSDPTLNIRAQHRDRLQHGIALEVAVEAASSTTEAVLLLMCALAVLLAARRPALLRLGQTC